MVRPADFVAYSSDAAFAIDEGSRIVAWNDLAEGLLGYTTDEAIGRSCADILQAVFANGEALCIGVCEGRGCFERGVPFSVSECRVRRKDGEMVAASLSSIAVPPGERDTDNVIAIVFIRGPHATSEKPASARQPGESSKQGNGHATSAPNWQAPLLRIKTLGRFGLVIDGNSLEVDKWKRRKAVAVLKFLATHPGRPIHRERLIELLWPHSDGDRGWQSLKVTVSFLRNKLREGGLGLDVVETIDQSYMLRGDAVWIDADMFDQLVVAGHMLRRQQRPEQAVQCLNDARRLYAGDFFESEPYEDWWARERGRLSELRFEMLADLADCHVMLGDYSAAARACRQALSVDSSRESFLRLLVECLAHINRADWAQPQIDAWQRVLVEELGINPTDEHLLLYQEVIANREGSASPIGAPLRRQGLAAREPTHGPANPDARPDNPR